MMPLADAGAQDRMKGYRELCCARLSKARSESRPSVVRAHPWRALCDHRGGHSAGRERLRLGEHERAKYGASYLR